MRTALVVTLAVLSLAALASAWKQPPLAARVNSAELAPHPLQLKLTGHGAALSCALHNPSETLTVSLLTYGTPLENMLAGDSLVVLPEFTAGVEVDEAALRLPYRGMIAKRAPPSQADNSAFVTVTPGGTVPCPARVHVDRHYAVEPNTRYRVAVNVHVHFRTSDMPVRTHSAQGVALSTKLGDQMEHGASLGLLRSNFVDITTGDLVESAAAAAAAATLKASQADIGSVPLPTPLTLDAALLDGAAPKPKKDFNLQTITTIGCTASRQTLISNAADRALNSQSYNSLKYVSIGAAASGSWCTTVYFTRWYGTNTVGDSGWTTMRTRWTALNGALGQNYKTDCTGTSCPSNTYAFVYPSDATRTIYLCSVYWQDGPSQAGTLVHEMSHFTTVTGTDDYVYGQTDCKALAISNPTQARANADSQEYLGEENNFVGPNCGTAPSGYTGPYSGPGSSTGSTPVDTCNQFSTCSTCNASSVSLSCGWCSATDTCSFGSSSGPQDYECGATGAEWQWHRCSPAAALLPSPLALVLAALMALAFKALA